MPTQPGSPEYLATAGKFYEHERYRGRAMRARRWIVPIGVATVTLVAWLFSIGYLR
jgi:hypothetical protein